MVTPRGSSLIVPVLLTVFVLVMPLTDLAHALSGNGWRKLEDRTVRVAYVSGIIDSMQTIKSLGEEAAEARGATTKDYWRKQPLAGMFAWYACTALVDMPLDQQLAMLDKYVSDHPEHWQFSMTAIIMMAFTETCKSEPGA